MTKLTDVNFFKKPPVIRPFSWRCFSSATVELRVRDVLCRKAYITPARLTYRNFVPVTINESTSDQSVDRGAASAQYHSAKRALLMKDAPGCERAIDVSNKTTS